MKNNKTGFSGRFKPGYDPRRNKGAKGKEAHSFTLHFANALSTGGSPQELADILWEKARKGQPWAIEIMLDRLIGKVSQPTDHSGEIKHVLSFDFGSDNGNGNGKENG